jgi:hypothetical protein
LDAIYLTFQKQRRLILKSSTINGFDDGIIIQKGPRSPALCRLHQNYRVPIFLKKSVSVGLGCHWLPCSQSILSLNYKEIKERN